MNSDDGALAALAQRFNGRGWTFRCYPDARCECLTFQAGVLETAHVIVEQRLANPSLPPRCLAFDAEVFRLVAFAATAGELADKLAQLPPPPWRELLG